MQSNNELHVSIGGNTYLLQLDPLQNYSGSSFRLSSDGKSGTDIEVTSATELFTSGADRVNFNNLSASQQAAIADGADIYDGLGGNDIVILPNTSNYNVSVGSGQTLNWQNSAEQPFSTDSRPGDTYTVSGGDGNYFIDAGGGTDVITISGNGSSTVVGSAGVEKILFAGTGDNIVSAGSGSGTYELVEAAGTNGHAVLSGNIVNTSSGVILASGAGAHIDLGYGTTISGGTLRTAGTNAVVDVIGAGTTQRSAASRLQRGRAC